MKRVRSEIMHGSESESNEPQESGPPKGWTLLRVVAFVASFLSLVGFGACGALGLSVTLSDFNQQALNWTLVGLLLTGLSFLSLRAVWRRVRGKQAKQ